MGKSERNKLNESLIRLYRISKSISREMCVIIVSYVQLVRAYLNNAN